MTVVLESERVCQFTIEPDGVKIQLLADPFRLGAQLEDRFRACGAQLASVDGFKSVWGLNYGPGRADAASRASLHATLHFAAASRLGGAGNVVWVGITPPELTQINITILDRPADEAMVITSCPPWPGFAAAARQIGGVFHPEAGTWHFDMSEEGGFFEDAVLALLRRFYSSPRVMIHRHSHGPVPVNTTHKWPSDTATPAENAAAGERKLNARRPDETDWQYQRRLRRQKREAASPDEARKAKVTRLRTERVQLLERLLVIDKELSDLGDDS